MSVVTATIYEVKVAVEGRHAWVGLFLQAPDRTTVQSAIEHDLAEMVESCESAVDDEKVAGQREYLGHLIEMLSIAKPILCDTGANSGANQRLRREVHFAGLLIGTIVVTKIGAFDTP